MKTFSAVPDGETLIPISCALCGESRHKSFWNCGSFRFQKCQGCGVVYQNPQPLPSNILERYAEAYYHYELENEENFFRLMMLGLKDTGFFDLEKSAPSERSFLDIGCATGRLLEEMRKRGWRTAGVEVCAPSAAHARNVRGLDIHQGLLETAPFPEASFDVVHFSHVIEHINDPTSFMRRVRNLLKPGGSVFVVTPCFTGIQARLFQTRWRSAIADHLYLFSKRQLALLLHRAELRPVRWKTWGGLGVGTAPQGLKRLVDPMAKALGLGDVMMVRGCRPG